MMGIHVSLERNHVDFQWPDLHAFGCDRGGMAAAVSWLDAHMQALGLNAATRQRVQLLLDELYANTLLHGGDAARAAPVALGLRRCGCDVHLYYVDAGDPFDTARAARDSRPMTGQQVGGVGLHLLQQLTCKLDYERRDGQNRIVATLVRFDPPGV